MLFYFSLYFIFSLFSMLELMSKKSKITHSFFCVSVLLLFVFSFIRWETGTDWDSYLTMFSWFKIPWETFDVGMELGFAFVQNLGRFLFDEYTGVLFLFALIIYSCIYYSYPKLCKYPMIALLASFSISFASMLFVRQNVAGAILLISLMFAYKRKFWLFILAIFVASLFHRTSWIFIIIYPLFGKVYKQKSIILWLIVSVIIGILTSKLILGVLGTLFTGVIGAKINMYLDMGTDDNSMAYSTTFILLKGIANRCFLMVFFLCIINETVRKKDNLLNGLFNIYVLGTILYCVLLPLSISLARIAVYMDIVQVFLISATLAKQKKRINKLLLFVVFWVYYLMRFYTYLMSYEHEFIPYKTIFQNPL